RLFVKTHLLLTEKLPFLANTERAIHILRHPKDVLLSGMNYARLEGVGAPSDAAYAREFIAHGGDPAWARMGFGTWAEHAASWRATDRFPVHSTTYEALKADTTAELRAMLVFIGETIDEPRLARAVELSAFDRLREIERKEKARGGESLFRGGRESLARNAMFMNKGASGQTLAHIDPALDRQFDEMFAAALERYSA
ncbi:MAG TPA: sulfotransferase domain-containing protein, partial [Phycisphaerales bacterium]|nr:sulfotransferase domain-containing protein [Phycisphaerales bacterium]